MFDGSDMKSCNETYSGCYYDSSKYEDDQVSKKVSKQILKHVCRHIRWIAGGLFHSSSVMQLQ